MGLAINLGSVMMEALKKIKKTVNGQKENTWPEYWFNLGRRQKGTRKRSGTSR